MVKKFLLSLKVEPQITTALLIVDEDGRLQMQKMELVKFEE